MDPFEETAGPTCPVHPGETAHGVCDRCGAYLCGVCTLGGAFRNCASCRRFTGEEAFPFDRRNFEFGGVMGVCWERFKAHWPMLCVAALIVFGVSLVFSAARQAVVMLFGFAIDESGMPLGVAGVLGVVTVASFVVEYAISWTMNLGLYRVCLDVLAGRPAEIPRLFSQFRKMGKVVLQGFAAILAVGIPFMLWILVGAGAVMVVDGTQMRIALGILVFAVGVVPFTYYVLPFFFMQLELAYNDAAGPIAAILHAGAVVRERRWITLGTVVLMMLLWVSGLLACCIGLVPAWAFAQLLASGVFLALRNGADVPAAPLDVPSPTAGTAWPAT
jgi:hypothetical protein